VLENDIWYYRQKYQNKTKKKIDAFVAQFTLNSRLRKRQQRGLKIAE